ncbi:hypothetical protein Scep_013991 [Stephania cephalantha]|uniref:Uncharacterized protein n=1 Tax=Stephania cephalantha TaxID=152367 RepID=A0AAP0J1Q5_9MAGN
MTKSECHGEDKLLLDTNKAKHVKKGSCACGPERCDIDVLYCSVKKNLIGLKVLHETYMRMKLQSTHCYLWLTGRHSTNSF